MLDVLYGRTPAAQNTTTDTLALISEQARDIPIESVTSLPGNPGKNVGRSVSSGTGPPRTERYLIYVYILHAQGYLAHKKTPPPRTLP